jgi:hypothetical protein
LWEERARERRVKDKNVPSCFQLLSPTKKQLGRNTTLSGD